MEKAPVKTVNEAVHKIQLLLLDGIHHEKQLFTTRSLLSRADYEDVVTERAISNICGYPLCQNPLPSYDSGKGRYRIALKEHTVYDLQETRKFCSSECVINSRAFSASLKSEQHSVYDFINVEEVLRLFEDFSLGDQEKIVEKKEKSGLPELKIVERKDVKDGVISLEEWIGPANAIEGYVPLGGQYPSPSREKGTPREGPRPDMEKEIFGDNSDFTSEIIVGHQMATPKKPSFRKKNIASGSNAVTVGHESSVSKKSSRKKDLSDRKVKKSGKEVSVREGGESTETSLNISSSMEAKALDGSTEKVELDVSSSIQTKALDVSTEKVVEPNERLLESSKEFTVTGEKLKSSKKSLGTKTSMEATESIAHAENDHLVSMSNSSGSNKFKDPSERKGEMKGMLLKSSLKSSRERAPSRSVTWADEKKSGNIDDSKLCKFQEIENRCEGKGSLEASVREDESISFRVVSAEACAQALTQAAEAVASGEFDTGDAVSEAGICILPHDAEGSEDVSKPHQDGSKWPRKPVLLDTDAFDCDDSWHDSPPEGFSLTLSPFSTMWMALFGWISSSSLTYIYGGDGCGEDAFSCVNGIEYPRKTFLSDGQSLEIKQTLAVCIAQALPELTMVFRISTPISTLEKAVLAFLETMSFLDALPPFKRKQWHVIVLLFLEALSISRVPSLTQQMANTREIQQKVLNGAQLSTEEYKIMQDLLMPLGQTPESVQSDESFSIRRLQDQRISSERGDEEDDRATEENLKMEDSDPSAKRWEDMQIDLLVKIFQQLTVPELVSGISQVCSTWRLACMDPILWKNLDLGQWKSNYIKIPSSPYIWVADESTKELTRVLRIAVDLSCGSINSMIFHYNLYMNDKHLLYVAERSPRLKRLVLPGWNLITKDAMIKAINMWKELVSLTMPSVRSPDNVMQQIGINCKNFSELKVMGVCDTKFVQAISAFIPKLKVLSLRCSKLYLEDLLMILDNLQHLQVLNISHCVLVETYPAPEQPRFIRKLDIAILKKAARLQSFMYCMEETCIPCQRALSDDGIMRWYNYEDGFWAIDEVSSLAH
ncbi:hypothetical protein H6P81_016931 [Aristolochia fimbriata]|uniref:RNA polymerase II subunit B1 CTD phosphatase RPAP2 homolog n=1 Tax=Aristolochia fimbriata TaxID=158543 RepID=A0AAV7DZT4_ARIFI|nr:hypothetical protein H6P81_016931 [Aristolochia fimbriata]